MDKKTYDVFQVTFHTEKDSDLIAVLNRWKSDKKMSYHVRQALRFYLSSGLNPIESNMLHEMARNFAQTMTQAESSPQSEAEIQLTNEWTL